MFYLGLQQVFSRSRPSDDCQHSGHPTMHRGSEGRFPSECRVFAGDWKIRDRRQLRADVVRAAADAGDNARADGDTDASAAEAEFPRLTPA